MAATLTMITGVAPVHAASIFTNGDLIVSSSTYEGSASTVAIGQALPGGGNATNNGAYPGVFFNATPDSSFGVTAPIFLSQFSTTGAAVNLTGQGSNTLAIPTSSVVTSFSSKSELSLNLTPNGAALTFMGYATGINQLDISNSATPGIPDSGNTDLATPTQRLVAQVNLDGSVQTTSTNAYGGNNGRSALLAPNGFYYTVGNAGNGGSKTPATSTGVQLLTPGVNAPLNSAGTFQVGSYSITQNGYAADKPIKDNNFRGETDFNGTLYVTKGSGSNGIDTVYQVGAAGSLNSAPGTQDSATISILPGFNTNLTSTASGLIGEMDNPFGIWFANSTTLYVADEGNDDSGTGGQANIYGGLEKWSFNGSVWVEDYVLQGGLNLGTNYTVSGTDFAGDTGSYTTATDGLRDLTGEVNADGTVTLFAITSTISTGTGDQGADPNELVSITDVLADTSAAQVTGENFNTLDTAVYGQVLRGVSFAPTAAVPEPSTWATFGGGMLLLIGFGLRNRKRQTAK